MKRLDANSPEFWELYTAEGDWEPAAIEGHWVMFWLGFFCGVSFLALVRFLWSTQ